jgi:hypothetical protein
MPYPEDEEFVSSAKERGVPKDFTRWAISYLSGSGYDYQEVDIEAYYDNGLTFRENKELFKQNYPSQVDSKYEKMKTNEEVKHERAESYQRNAEAFIEDREAQTEKKREWVKGQIEKSTKVNRGTPELQESTKVNRGIPELQEDDLLEEKPKELDFFGKVGGFFEDTGRRLSEARAKGEKEKEFRARTNQKA